MQGFRQDHNEWLENRAEAHRLGLRRRLAREKDGKSPILDNIGNHSVKLLNPAGAHFKSKKRESFSEN